MQERRARGFNPATWISYLVMFYVIFALLTAVQQQGLADMVRSPAFLSKTLLGVAMMLSLRGWKRFRRCRGWVRHSLAVSLMTSAVILAFVSGQAVAAPGRQAVPAGQALHAEHTPPDETLPAPLENELEPLAREPTSVTIVEFKASPASPMFVGWLEVMLLLAINGLLIYRVWRANKAA